MIQESYTSEQTEWLRENYANGTINDTLDAFEREFGTRPDKHNLYSKADREGLRKKRQGEERHVPAQKTMRWSSPEFEREREWMLANDKTESVAPTIDAFEREFGIRLNRNQVSLFRSTYGTNRRKSHGGGKPNKPVGSERIGKDDYLMVKVREWPDRPCTKDNWRFKHHVEYERHHGPIPEGHIVLFADRDTRNFDPDNLVAIPRKYIGQLNANYDWNDRQSLEAAINCVKLKIAIVDAKNRPRPCGVCGREFKPPENLRGSVNNTCPECRSKGKRSFKMHGIYGEARCAVCGNTFTKNKKSQRRCLECIAEKPRHGVEAHAEYANRRKAK